MKDPPHWERWGGGGLSQRQLGTEKGKGRKTEKERGLKPTFPVLIKLTVRRFTKKS